MAKEYKLLKEELNTNNINKKNKVKKRFFASGQWYKVTLTIILWSVLQEIIMASTDLIDNIFVNHLFNFQINGLDQLILSIKSSGWEQLITKDILQNARLENLFSYAGKGMNYTAGQIGVNGVAASNQLFIIMFCMVSGFCYGSGIFSAQFFGASDYQKLKQVTALKLYLCLFISIVFMLFAIPGITWNLIAFTTKPSFAQLPELNLNTTKDSILEWFNYFQYQAAKLATQEGEKFYRIVSSSYFLLAINQVSITSLRETRRPFYSFFMAAIALCSNLVCNTFLTSPTFLGNFQGLGITGAAVGTVVSRILQTLFILSLLFIKKFEFIPHFKNFIVSKFVLRLALIKTIPILINETLYAFGQVLQVKLKAMYSVEALTANAMFETVLMAFFSPMYHGLNAGISTLVGNELGANKFENAKYNSTHLMRLSFIIGICFFAIFSGLSFVIPNTIFPNTLPEANRIGVWMIFIYSVIYPIIIINNCSYSILRAGGEVYSAFAMDSVFNWLVQIPLLAILIILNNNGTIHIDIVMIHLIVCLCEVVKVIPALIFYFRKKWVKNLIKNSDILINNEEIKISEKQEIKKEQSA
ncbi:MATE family efflux transporter [Spiroplasma taiwanense]|uniref:MATE efflux family protein n=1 Tax=Spiroplasma taiwanense CT-1 TaxID=1276220 RepID=S5LT34_9MOLU|nr:MATE family efflux transporter [Spiroplasma taiwanense]AGR40849.1 MATE efflux family protein [Spiroplasma taiwanense CT-1]